MPRMPRLAVGTVQRLADSQLVTWALMQALRRCGREIQHFASRTVLPAQGAATITGYATRFLDSWVMSPDVCQSLFLRGTTECDLAIVEGAYVPRGATPTPGGCLDSLCQWLCLPRVVIIDVRQLSTCNLPEAPAGIEGVLLDRIGDEADLARWQTTFETIWGVPVLGALDECAAARSFAEQLRPDEHPPAELCNEVGARFASRSKFERLATLADRSALAACADGGAYCLCRATGRLRIAVAYDRAFHGYFGDMLELLEQGGAEVVAFSPLADEALPEDIDLVYLGNAQIESHAEALANNQCMLMALRSWGGAAYAEGGGLAYLCENFEDAAGRHHTLTAALPATARYYRSRGPAEPCELVLPRDSWLGAAGVRLRGYRPPCWQISLSPTAGVVATPDESPSLLVRRGLVGSLAQINFAAQPELLSRFFSPARSGLRFSPSQVAL